MTHFLKFIDTVKQFRKTALQNQMLNVTNSSFMLNM